MNLEAPKVCSRRVLMVSKCFSAEAISLTVGPTLAARPRSMSLGRMIHSLCSCSQRCTYAIPFSGNPDVVGVECFRRERHVACGLLVFITHEKLDNARGEGGCRRVRGAEVPEHRVKDLL